MARFAPTVDRIDCPVFLVIGRDVPDAGDIRDTALDGHLEYIEKNVDRYVACGPMREPGKSDFIGSYFLVMADDEAAARDLVSGDPYVRAGLYRDLEISEVGVAAGTALGGGVIWESADAIRARARGIEE